jgi:hypothetical protein
MVDFYFQAGWSQEQDVEFPPGHPQIAGSQSNLAMVLADLGELDEAKELLTLAYHALLEKQGSDFPLTKTVKENLEYVIRRAKESRKRRR